MNLLFEIHSLSWNSTDFISQRLGPDRKADCGNRRLGSLLVKW
jgi:hypothetical protein